MQCFATFWTGLRAKNYTEGCPWHLKNHPGTATNLIQKNTSIQNHVSLNFQEITTNWIDELLGEGALLQYMPILYFCINWIESQYGRLFHIEILLEEAKKAQNLPTYLMCANWHTPHHRWETFTICCAQVLLILFLRGVLRSHFWEWKERIPTFCSWIHFSRDPEKENEEGKML